VRPRFGTPFAIELGGFRGRDIVSEVLDAQRVFGKTLDATSGTNRFRDPSLPPGEGASRLEGLLLRLERLLAGRVAQLLDRPSLTRSERETVAARILAFLSLPGNALVPSEGERGAFRVELGSLLASFEVPEAERREMLDRIIAVIEESLRRRAA
jgi:hypothetical protein